jgi:MinD superfamily P-loop ATPase
MKQLIILSGKGGTGKTTIAAAFAVLVNNATIADCDVDAPDLHILLHPHILKIDEFKGSKLAVIDQTKCVKCGLCRERCRFEAVKENLTINPFSCEGCGVCAIVCPTSTITMIERVSGYAYISRTKYGPMAHALLSPGESNSGKLATLVKQNAKMLAERARSDFIIIDGPPGIGCPVIASITGADAGLVVTEPTLSGIHDLGRALGLLAYFHVTPFVCVNMFDINKENTEKIVIFCKENCIDVVGKIPFDPIVTESMVKKMIIMEYAPKSNVTGEIKKMWIEILSSLKKME